MHASTRPAVEREKQGLSSMSAGKDVRGLNILENEVRKICEKLEKSRPQLLKALAGNNSTELEHKLFLKIAGLAEVLHQNGNAIQGELSSTSIPRARAIATRLMARAEEVRDEILQEGFTELKMPPRICCANIRGGFLEIWKRGSRYYVDIQPMVLLAPREALKGGLSHEIAHAVSDSKLTEKERDEDELKYEASKVYRRNVERETDLEVVRRGLGKALLAFLNWVDARGYIAGANGRLKRTELRRFLTKNNAI